MKKTIAFLVLANFFSTKVISQNWLTAGNAVTASQFIGTTNGFDLNFKTNATLSTSPINMALTKSGVLRVTNLAGTGTRFLTVDASGNLTPGITSTGTASQVLYGNGTWGALPTSPWTASGTDLFNANTGNIGIGINPTGLTGATKLNVNGGLRVGGGANYLSLQYDGVHNAIDGVGPLTSPDKNDLLIGYYSPMNVSINSNTAGYGNLGVGGNINVNSNVNIGSPAAATTKLNILAPDGKYGIVSRTNHLGINSYNTLLFTNKHLTKAFAIQDEEITNATLRETFMVYGNGSTTINSETINANQAMFTINAANATNIYENKFVVYADGRTVIGDVNGYFPAPALGYKLAVNGKIVASEVLVALRASWPDYVFNNNYKLKSIDELDTYIKVNKHLPNIPSASEMSAGIETGSIITKQMEKIEELTLYIIEQNKKIQAQEKRLQAIEAKIK
jgi:hypothetical protein